LRVLILSSAQRFLSQRFTRKQVPWPFPPRPGAAPQTFIARSITVAFWNIQWFPGRRPNATRREENRQINSVHRDMVELNADIIGMEEVRDFARAGVAVAPPHRIQGGCLREFSTARKPSRRTTGRHRQPLAAVERVGGKNGNPPER